MFAGLLNDDAWEAQINALREADERAGIVCRQTHCVSTNYARYQTLDAEHLRLLEQRCIRTAAILGAEWTVIHPFAPEGAAREESIRYFCEYLKPLENWLANWAWALPLKTCPTSRKSAFAARRKMCIRDRSMAEYMLHDCGAYRVHGGGFAGTTLNLVPQAQEERFLRHMRQMFEMCIRDRGNRLRDHGAGHLAQSPDQEHHGRSGGQPLGRHHCR